MANMANGQGQPTPMAGGANSRPTLRDQVSAGQVRQPVQGFQNSQGTGPMLTHPMLAADLMRRRSMVQGLLNSNGGQFNG